MSHTYSPSQATTFAVCPVKWWLAYKAGEHGKGLVPNMVSSMQAYDRLAGDAGHKMLATWYLTGNMDAAIVAGHAAVDAGLEVLKGNVYEAPSADELKAMVTRLGNAYALRYPTEAWKVVAVEALLIAPATCRLDLLVIDADGEPAVIEHKFPGPKARIDQQAGRWRMAYQPMNYCWAVDEARQAFGLTKPCRRIIMNFVQRVGKVDPTKHLVRHNVEVKEHLLGIHKQQAERLWSQMGKAEAINQASQGSQDIAGAADSEGVTETKNVVCAADNPIWPNWEACDTRWGRCEFIPLCESGWDEAVERGLYRSKGGGEATSPASGPDGYGAGTQGQGKDGQAVPTAN